MYNYKLNYKLIDCTNRSLFDKKLILNKHIEKINIKFILNYINQMC